jgi:streptomycin 6-kinase
MRAAAYDVAATRGVTVGETACELLAKGGDAFLEQRIAAYRLIASLGRRTWFAAEVALVAKALEMVVDPNRESTPPGCRWRHEAAAGLLAAARAQSGDDARVSDAATARLERSVAGGPFGRGVGGQAAVLKVAAARR